MPQLQTIEKNIESPLLYTTEENRQATQVFVHDSIGEFFLAKNLLQRAREGSLSIAELHNIIGFRGHEMAGQRFQKTFKFLRDLFGNDYYPDRLNSIIADPKVQEIADIQEHYGLGQDSRLIIRIKDDSYCNCEGQLEIAKLCGHLHDAYGVQLFCTEGAEGFVDTGWFRNMNKSFNLEEALGGDLSKFGIKKRPDDEVIRDTAMYFMKKGEMLGIEYLGITGKDEIIIYGVEDKALYLQEQSAVGKDDKDKTDEDHDKESHAHKERMTILVENTLKAMEEYHQDIAVLLYGGGYLYDIDLSPLISAGASYVFLKPKISGVNWKLYRKIHHEQTHNRYLHDQG